MKNADIVQALRENANALRRVAARRHVSHAEENDLRTVAANLDTIALEFATTVKDRAKADTLPDTDRPPPFGEEGPR